MKITIDTKEDSHEDIRKIVSLLSTMVEGGNSMVSDSSNNTFDNNTPTMSNIFESDSPDLTDVSQYGLTQDSIEPQPITSGFANMFGDDNSNSVVTDTSSPGLENFEESSGQVIESTNIFSDIGSNNNASNENQAGDVMEGPPSYDDKITQEEKDAANLVTEY